MCRFLDRFSKDSVSLECTLFSDRTLFLLTYSLFTFFVCLF